MQQQKRHKIVITWPEVEEGTASLYRQDSYEIEAYEVTTLNGVGILILYDYGKSQESFRQAGMTYIPFTAMRKFRIER